MNQTREIKNFIYSQYFSDGLRISFGVLLPPLLLSQLGHLETGIAVSMGAITTSIPDNPGAVIHKRNAMLYAILFMVLTSLLTGFINDYPLLVAIEIFLLCFFFSMFTIYGNRASAIGTAVLIIMIINIDQDFNTVTLLQHTGFLLAGGVWYMALSLAVSQFRPYRIAQHTLGECIDKVSEYLRLKAGFYSENAKFGDTFEKLAEQHIIVHQQQDMVREVLFKNRMFQKDPTNTARLLVLVFIDIIDLFEQTMATHYDYRSLHQSYGHTGVLKDFEKVILNLAKELQNLGYDINANERPRLTQDFSAQLEQLKTRIDGVENNFVLKKILINVRNISNRITTIYSYFSHKRIQDVRISSEKDLGRFVSTQNLDPKLFIENFSFDSAVFRHALRVSIVAVIGYLISKLLPLGHHSYWILLTILVILKPGFSLTKERNYQRLIGTIIGGVAGALIVYFVKDSTARFAFLLVFMLGAYSFQRLNYVVSVLFMTPYILIMFSFIGYGNLSLVQERIIDTFIGSFIALIASYFLFPSWEYPNLQRFMRKLLISNYHYLFKAAEGLLGQGLSLTEYKLDRKELYVASANMSSAFQRMLSEPKNKQKNVREANNFIVQNHVLSSYIATLMSSVRHEEQHEMNPSHVKQIRKALYQLSESITRLAEPDDEPFREQELQVPEFARTYDGDSTEAALISEQLDFINKATGDILKTVQRYMA